MKLEEGNYDESLPIHELNGKANAPIVIQGSGAGIGSVFRARPNVNTISIRNASHVEVRNIVVDGRGLGMDGVKAEGNSAYAHDITLVGLKIANLGGDQQTVGISTKCPAWNWVIRDTTIIGAGTGMYFGGAAGSAPFVGGLIEGNRILDTVGYNLEIKHQVSREGVPSDAPGETIIRRNTFVKGSNSSVEVMARPNVLLGHFPSQGPGRDDRYLVYGNYFYGNPTESLFQAEGNVALYNNIFFNPLGDAIVIQPHNDIPKSIWIFHNTVVSRDTGIHVRAVPGTLVQEVVANAVFAASPLVGGKQQANLVRSYHDAALFFQHFGNQEALDFHPRPGAMPDVEWRSDTEDFEDAGYDFDGRRRDQGGVGAYIGRGSPQDWRPGSGVAPFGKRSVR